MTLSPMRCVCLYSLIAQPNSNPPSPPPPPCLFFKVWWLGDWGVNGFKGMEECYREFAPNPPPPLSPLSPRSPWDWTAPLQRPILTSIALCTPTPPCSGRGGVCRGAQVQARGV